MQNILFITSHFDPHKQRQQFFADTVDFIDGFQFKLMSLDMFLYVLGTNIFLSANEKNDLKDGLMD